MTFLIARRPFDCLLDSSWKKEEAMKVSKAQAIARTAMIILTGAMIASGFNMMMTQTEAQSFGVLPKDVASAFVS